MNGKGTDIKGQGAGILNRFPYLIIDVNKHVSLVLQLINTFHCQHLESN